MILITGGCGFIGSVYAHYIQENHQDEKIIICDRFRSDEKWRNLLGVNIVDFISPDDFKQVRKYSKVIKSVIHLGACSSTTEKDMDFLYRNNVEFSKKVFFFCLENGIPFLYASSAATYGNGENGNKKNNYNVDIENLQELKPLNKYGYSKQIFDLWVRDFLKEFNQLIFDCSHLIRKIYEEIKAENKLKTKFSLEKILEDENKEDKEIKKLFSFLKNNSPKYIYKKLIQLKYWQNIFENNNYFSAIGFKFFNVFGRNEYHKGSMASVIFHAYNQIKETGEVKLFKSYKKGVEDGEQQRDFVYVEDVCEVIDNYRKEKEEKYSFQSMFGNNNFIRSKVFQIINIGTGKANTFRQLVEYVFEALGKEPNIKYINMPDGLKKNYQYYTQAEILENDKQFYRPLKESVTDYVKNYLEKRK